MNSVVKTSVVLHNSSRIGKGLLYDIGGRSAVNQSDFRILSEEDGGWQTIEGTAFENSPGCLFINLNYAVLVEHSVNYAA